MVIKNREKTHKNLVAGGDFCAKIAGLVSN
jgi:hypothetical protein